MGTYERPSTYSQARRGSFLGQVQSFAEELAAGLYQAYPLEVKVGPAALGRMFGVSEAYCGDYLKKQLGVTFQGRTTRQETLRFLNAYCPERGPVCADKKNTALTRVSLTFCGGFSPDAIAARLQGLFPAGAAVSVTVDISAVEA